LRSLERQRRCRVWRSGCARRGGGPVQPASGAAARGAMNAPLRMDDNPARRAIIPLLAIESAKYFLASAAALALDYGLLVSLTEFGRLNYLASAAIGFTAGLVLNYMLSVRFVFRERRLESRRLEILGFALIGLAGLALNEVLMMALVEWAG